MFGEKLKRMIWKCLKKAFVRYLWTVDAINGIDTLDKKTVNYIPELQNHVIISGWLFDAKEDNNIIDFFIEIDGKSHTSLYGLIRTDVSSAYKDKKYRNSGFRCIIPKKEFQVGKVYTINFRIRTKNDTYTTIKTPVSFSINAEKAGAVSSTSNEAIDYSQYLGELLAFKYIAGTGVEIGALHAPLSVDHKKANVLYVDRMSQKDLHHQYPEFKKEDIVDADIIDNGDELATIADNAYDFCISNHVLEHLEDPIKALYNWMRILKPKGLLYMSIPLPHNIVDKYRQPTTIAHIIEDHGLMMRDSEKYGKERHSHYLDFVRSTNFSESANNEFINRKTAELLEMNYSIHFHVFSEETLLRMIDCVAQRIAIKIVEFVRNEPEEFIFIIEKQALPH
jgi:predicted SAM-dependent methyltransferase